MGTRSFGGVSPGTRPPGSRQEKWCPSSTTWGVGRTGTGELTSPAGGPGLSGCPSSSTERSGQGRVLDGEDTQPPLLSRNSGCPDLLSQDTSCCWRETTTLPGRVWESRPWEELRPSWRVKRDPQKWSVPALWDSAEDRTGAGPASDNFATGAEKGPATGSAAGTPAPCPSRLCLFFA